MIMYSMVEYDQLLQPSLFVIASGAAPMQGDPPVAFSRERLASEPRLSCSGVADQEGTRKDPGGRHAILVVELGNFRASAHEFPVGSI